MGFLHIDDTTSFICQEYIPHILRGPNHDTAISRGGIKTPLRQTAGLLSQSIPICGDHILLSMDCWGHIRDTSTRPTTGSR